MNTWERQLLCGSHSIVVEAKNKTNCADGNKNELMFATSETFIFIRSAKYGELLKRLLNITKQDEIDANSIVV